MAEEERTAESWSESEWQERLLCLQLLLNLCCSLSLSPSVPPSLPLSLSQAGSVADKVLLLSCCHSFTVTGLGGLPQTKTPLCQTRPTEQKPLATYTGHFRFPNHSLGDEGSASDTVTQVITWAAFTAHVEPAVTIYKGDLIVYDQSLPEVRG